MCGNQYLFDTDKCIVREEASFDFLKFVKTDVVQVGALALVGVLGKVDKRPLMLLIVFRTVLDLDKITMMTNSKLLFLFVFVFVIGASEALWGKCSKGYCNVIAIPQMRA